MLQIGRKAPDFELNDDKGRVVRLTDLLEDGSLVFVA